MHALVQPSFEKEERKKKQSCASLCMYCALWYLFGFVCSCRKRTARAPHPLSLVLGYALSVGSPNPVLHLWCDVGTRTLVRFTAPPAFSCFHARIVGLFFFQTGNYCRFLKFCLCLFFVMKFYNKFLLWCTYLVETREVCSYKSSLYSFWYL